MSHWIGVAILIIGFLSLVKFLKLVEKSGDVLKIANYSLGIISSRQLSDDEKESELQKNSKKLFGLFFILAFAGAIALLLPFGLVWFLDKMGWLSLSSVLSTTLSPSFLIISSVIVILFFLLKPNNSTSTTSYSQLDKTLHQLAFSTYTAQIALADFEQTMLSKGLTNCQTNKPVFITALPRAGTTLILECFAKTPEFASHCYRDMPFVLIPLLWNRFSKAFQLNVESQERAHGDGMKINPDSPEALEEVLWTTFWQRHYHKDRIIPWESEEKVEEFDDFFRSHMSKIILLRHENSTDSVRYVSKNNANIARIKILKKLFPDSVIIIPFRHPLHHCASLLQQHLNFLRIHKEDSFASEYMKAIGHYDFGENLRPIDFDNWLDKRQSKDAESISFWLEYWVASYKYLLTNKEYSLNFFNYEALCEDPERGLSILAEVTQSNDPEALVANANRISRPKPREINTVDITKSLMDEVNSVYASLKGMALK